VGVNPELLTQAVRGDDGAGARVAVAGAGAALTAGAMIAFGLQRRDFGVVLAFLGGVLTVVATAGAMLDAEQQRRMP